MSVVALKPGSLAEQVMAHPDCLLAVRHGRTVWNAEDRLTTRTDVPLDDRGHAQATLVARSLRGARFDRAYASPLRRARATAELALTGVDDPPRLSCDRRLMEPDAGPFEGCRFPELRAGPQAEAFTAYLREADPVVPAGCESLSDCAKRARAFLDEVSRLPGRSLLASHGLFIRVLACEVLDISPISYRHFKLSNAHAVLVKFHPAPPHQLAGVNIPPAA
jgi:broad specificity phosphatase PhoE